MKADERELAAMRLRQIANEIGLELPDERLDRLVRLLESTVDGVRTSADLVLEEEQPAFVPDLYPDDAEMIDQELCYASISDLSWRIERRDISPVELTRAVLERAALLDQQLNCFITLLPDEALAAAEAAEREIMAGQVRGPLHGVPYSVKDLYATRGIRTTAGSKVLADWVPDFDATVVARLKAAGAILIGKCNTSEFAGGPENKNPHYGAAHNPWDTRCIPGRLQRRFGRGGRGWTRGLLDGLGHGRIGPDSGRCLRRGRTQADLWPGQQVRRDRPLLVARHLWPAGAHS